MALPLSRVWNERKPLRRQWVLPDGVALARPVVANCEGPPFDFTGRMTELIGDIAVRYEPLQFIDRQRILVTFTPTRNASRYGLQARVTPMRFQDGALERRLRGRSYRVQQYVVNGREILYLVTFCLPRFLNHSPEEKLITIFHELFHISPNFDGDLRRHNGRYCMHTHSKAGYDREMAAHARRYLALQPEPHLTDFLRFDYRQLWMLHGGITGIVVPQPKLIPLQTPIPAAASR